MAGFVEKTQFVHRFDPLLNNSHLSNIKNEIILGNAENQTRDSWVRSTATTSVQYRSHGGPKENIADFQGLGFEPLLNNF